MKLIENKSIVFLFYVLLVSLILLGCSSGKQVQTDGNTNQSEKKEKTEFLNVSTGAESGAAYAYAASISKLVSDEFPEIQLTVQNSGGGKENLARLVNNRSHIGFVYGPDIESAVKGIGEYEGMKDKYSDLYGIFSWPYASVQAIVREDSGIDKFEDLKGKKISVGAPGSTGSTFVWPIALPEFGVTEKNSNWQYLSVSAAVDGMADGSIDAVLIIGKHKDSSIESMSLSRKIKMLEIPDPIRETIIKNGVGLVKEEQNPELYGKNQVNDGPIPTIGMSGTFVVRGDVSEDTVYKITKAIFENIDEFHQSHSAAKDVTLEAALKDMSVPLHPGAEKYFKEVGLLE